MQLKKIINLTFFSIFTALLIIPACAQSSQAAQEPLVLNLATKTIQISTFYNGTTLEVTGSIPADEDVVLQVKGPKKDVHLKEKGKVAGFLWMNKNDVSLENTPAVYMVYVPAGSGKNFLSTELGIGYAALVNDITIIPESADKAFIFAEYVKLMEKSGGYIINDTAITYGKTGNGIKDFSATLNVPSKMNAGSYIVEAISIKDSVVTSKAQEDLTLELTGFPALISSLAFGRPLLFGFMAVFIAVATGLLIGVIFRGGGGAH
jgi:uncharacterized protein (TIGR02186 family)